MSGFGRFREQIANIEGDLQRLSLSLGTDNYLSLVLVSQLKPWSAVLEFSGIWHFSMTAMPDPESSWFIDGLFLDESDGSGQWTSDISVELPRSESPPPLLFLKTYGDLELQIVASGAMAFIETPPRSAQ